MNAKLNAVTGAIGCLISLFIAARQVSDYTRAAARLDGLPRARWLLGDRAYDADRLRDAGRPWHSASLAGSPEANSSATTRGDTTAQPNRGRSRAADLQCRFLLVPIVNLVDR